MRKMNSRTSLFTQRDPFTVEGTISVIPQDQVDSTQPSQRYFRERARRKILSWLPVPIVLAVTLLLLGYIYLWSTATVVVFPETFTQNAESAVTATLHPTGETQSLARRLTANAISTFQPVHPTGTLTLPAVAASGILTWYNQTAYTQTVSPNTVITVSSTLQVVSPQQVTVPAGSESTIGETSAPARVLQAGIAGNIAVGIINQFCNCGEAQGIRVKNTTAFSGGQDAQTHTVVQASDITEAVASQNDATKQQTLAALEKEAVSPDLIVGRTPSCTSKVVTNHPLVASETELQAAVSVTCQTMVTSKKEVSQKGIALFLTHLHPASDASQHLDSVRAVRVQLIAESDEQEMMQLTVHVEGHWTHHMKQADCQALKRQIAGKTRWQASQFLLRFPGVSKASTIEQLLPWLALPAETQRILISPAHLCG